MNEERKDMAGRTQENHDKPHSYQNASSWNSIFMWGIMRFRNVFGVFCYWGRPQRIWEEWFVVYFNNSAYFLLTDWLRKAMTNISWQSVFCLDYDGVPPKYGRYITAASRGHMSWDSKVLRNVGIVKHHYRASQPRRPRLESSLSWKASHLAHYSW